MSIQLVRSSISGFCDRPVALDIHFSTAQYKCPLVIFCHGFKGFKDWGSFNYIANAFAENGIAFLKFNFSHNGTTNEKLTAFADLEAFGNNNFSKELEDLDRIINWVENEFKNLTGIENTSISLMGHSRGGSIAILKTAVEKRVKHLITWAAVADLEKWLNNFPTEKWKQDGVLHILNTRTNQNMPLYYQLYEDLEKNATTLNSLNAAQKITQPWLILHANDDAAVPPEEAIKLNSISKNSTMEILQYGGHTFGAQHPFDEGNVSNYLLDAIEKSIHFIKLNV